MLFIKILFYPTNIGFLRRNKRKDKKKKSSGKDEDGGESLKDIGSDGEDVHKSGTPTPEVDDEGLFTFLSAICLQFLKNLKIFTNFFKNSHF